MLQRAKEMLSRGSSLDVRIIRFIYRLCCFHERRDHLARSTTFAGPIIVSECVKCGHCKYQSVGGW